jgi:hypothetical protein
MTEVRQATADEVILAFLQAEIDSPTERGRIVAGGLAHICADRGQLIDHADLKNPQHNSTRCWLLGYARGYRLNQFLFVNFPDDTAWRLVTVTPAEVKYFKYVNHQQGWAGLSGSSRLVIDGLKNLDQAQNPQYPCNVKAIAARVRRGDRFPPLIAAQCTGAADMVLLEGHTRATAYALTGLPDEIEVFVGMSAHMANWMFF